MIPHISNQLVDASEAGEGSLEILVKSTANGQPSLPTHVESLGNAVFNVSFTPDTSIDHLIQVTFNDDHIPGKKITLGGFPIEIKIKIRYNLLLS